MGFLRFFYHHVRVAAKYLIKHIWTELPLLLKQCSGLKNSKKGASAFVFANGPSLLQLDPAKVKRLADDQKWDIFGVNSYISSEFGKIATPTAYVLSDPLHFGFATSTIDPIREQECRQDVERLLKIPNLLVFIPAWFRGKFPQSISPIPFSDVQSIFSPNSLDIRFPRNFSSMTAFKAIQIACFLGYDKIMIAGFDNNYFKTIEVDQNNTIWEMDAHFYDGAGKKRKVARPAYTCDNMAEYLVSSSMLFRDLTKFPKNKIENLIVNSLVDAFPKTNTLDIYMST